MQIRKQFFFAPFHSYILLILFSCFSFPNSLSSQNPDNTNYKEITKLDITRIVKITAHEINVFGVHLGMKMPEVKSILGTNSLITALPDPYNPMRYYVYDKSVAGQNKIPVAYLIWDEKTRVLKEITLYSEFSKYTIGRTNLLFSQDVFKKESDISKTFLGTPYKKKMLIDIPSIGLKSYAYYFYRNFMFTKNISEDGTTIYFSLMLKQE